MGARRKILVAGLGAAVITALEGLACGNPLEPRCPDSRNPNCPLIDAPVVHDAGHDGGVDAIPNDSVPKD